MKFIAIVFMWARKSLGGISLLAYGNPGDIRFFRGPDILPLQMMNACRIDTMAMSASGTKIHAYILEVVGTNDVAM